MKSVNDYVKNWAKELSPLVPSVNAVAQDVLKCVETYNYNLTWDQIGMLEPALGDLTTNRFNNRDDKAELLSIVGFIIACGIANNQK